LHDDGVENNQRMGLPWSSFVYEARAGPRASSGAPRDATTNDLLALWSDFYRLIEGANVVPVEGRELGSVFADLGSDHYRLRDFDARFPAGPPSLAKATRFVVRGDVTFGPEVTIAGEAELESG
jgi:UTP--glucose-1-phosphate uridylyltransferase